MLTLPDVTSLTVSLDVAGETTLFILLDRDGTMNRQGSGRAENNEYDMVIGTIATTALNHTLEPLTPEWLERDGVFQMPDPQGTPCELTLMLSGDKEALTFAFHYGTESRGVPPPFRTVVERAVEVTQAEYDRYRT
jgi:hypothetical protein